MPKFKISTQYEVIQSQLRRYRVDESIKVINRESVALFENHSNSELGIAKMIDIPIFVRGNRIPQHMQHYITPWNLVDLAYFLIKESNDYRSSSMDQNEVYIMHELIFEYVNREEIIPRKIKEEDETDFILRVYGLLGEQIKHQRTECLFDNLFRDIYILFDVDKSGKFNYSEILETEIGVSSWKSIVADLVRAWLGFTKVDTLEDVIRTIPWNNENDIVRFKRVISHYTADYKEIRNHKLGRQILYSKPFVRSQKGDIISVSTFLNLFVCEHSIFWIIRDHFKDGQLFTNHYGKLFETYLDEMLKSCLQADEYMQLLPENKKKRTDWKICIGDFKILVEQKTTLLRLNAKQQTPNLDDLKHFIHHAVLEALEQLDSTEKEFNDGKYIKVILLYDDYLQPEILDHIMNMPECNISNDNYYWIMTIREMELLLHTAKTDRNLLEEIIKEKIDRETTRRNESRTMDDIMRKKGIIKNEYIAQMKGVREIMALYS